MCLPQSIEIFRFLEDGSSTPAPASKPKETPAPAPVANKTATRGRGAASRGGKYYQRGGSRSATASDAAVNQDGTQEPAERKGVYPLRDGFT